MPCKPGVVGLLPGFYSLSDETKLWPHPHMTLAVACTSNKLKGPLSYAVLEVGAICYADLSIKYSKFSKILNTSCLSKQAQTNRADQDQNASPEAV